jgi:hypothetical protein
MVSRNVTFPSGQKVNYPCFLIYVKSITADRNNCAWEQLQMALKGVGILSSPALVANEINL